MPYTGGRNFATSGSAYAISGATLVKLADPDYTGRDVRSSPAAFRPLHHRRGSMARFHPVHGDAGILLPEDNSHAALVRGCFPLSDRRIFFLGHDGAADLRTGEPISADPARLAAQD